MMRFFLGVLFLGFLCVGCACVPMTAKQAASGAVLEQLYSVRRAENHLYVQVYSSGCTKPEHFVLRPLMQVNQFAVMRHVRDLCRRKPYLMEVSLPIPVDAENHFYLTNPILIESTGL